MFSEKIRQLRKDRHLTQAEVAKEVGLSARGYQDLELGAKPRYDALLHIADFYDGVRGLADGPHGQSPCTPMKGFPPYDRIPRRTI